MQHVPAGARFSGWNLQKLQGTFRGRGGSSKSAARGGRSRDGAPRQQHERRERPVVLASDLLAPPPSLSVAGSSGAALHARGPRVKIMDTVVMSEQNQALVTELLKELMAQTGENGGDASDIVMDDDSTVVSDAATTDASTTHVVSSHAVVGGGVALSAAAESDGEEVDNAAPANAPEQSAKPQGDDDEPFVGSYAVLHYLTKSLSFSERWAKKVRCWPVTNECSVLSVALGVMCDGSAVSDTVCGVAPTTSQALRETSGSDPVAALDWLCLHVSDAELAEAFATRVTRGSSGSGSSSTSEGKAPARKAFGRPYTRGGGARGDVDALKRDVMLRLHTEFDWALESLMFRLDALGFDRCMK